MLLTQTAFTSQNICSLILTYVWKHSNTTLAHRC